MDFRHYSDNAAALAAELVNLFNDAAEQGREVRTDDLGTVLAEHEVTGRPAEADVEPLHALADRLRGVFAAPDLEAAAARLNQLLGDSVAAPWITRHGGVPPHLHFAPPDATLVDRVAASTAMGLAVVLCDYGEERLGMCAAADCEDVFIDTSRNAQRRYCSQGCANRSNVAAHRARKREG
jgi:predicted RNA-binding Zn ribbon-like protein